MKQARIKWTTELIDAFLKETYPWVYLIPGQEYVNNKTPLWFYCTKPGHGEYKARVNNITSNTGSCCNNCKSEKTQARNESITAKTIGTKTIDGHTILELVGYHQSPVHKRKGERGNALLRFRCGVCGSEDSVARGGHLKTAGHIRSCGCLVSGKDSIQGYENNNYWANSDCYVYIADIDGKYIKPGIATNLKNRASVSEGRYNDYLFVSPKLSRCEAWAVEQNLLSITADAMPTLDELPDEYFLWGGKTELRIKDMFSLHTLRWKFDGLLRQLEKVGWKQLALNAS